MSAITGKGLNASLDATLASLGLTQTGIMAKDPMFYSQILQIYSAAFVNGCRWELEQQMLDKHYRDLRHKELQGEIKISMDTSQLIQERVRMDPWKELRI